MKTPYIFNIQKFSIHDGPGIRTTVFFKGCPLQCKWCHNPESQNPQPEIMKSGEGLQQNKTVGSRYTVDELVDLLKKDILFYDQSGGGVTLSGGEVMSQDMEFVVPLLQKLKEQGISVAVDTCGYAPKDNFSLVLPYVDCFLYDLKMIDVEKHCEYTGFSNQLILDNLRFISSREANIELRLLMIKDVNMDKDDIYALAEWLKKEQIRVSGITLLPYHDFGREKYQQLSRECTQNFTVPSNEELNFAADFLRGYGYSVTISE